MTGDDEFGPDRAAHSRPGLDEVAAAAAGLLDSLGAALREISSQDHSHRGSESSAQSGDEQNAQAAHEGSESGAAPGGVHCDDPACLVCRIIGVVSEWLERVLTRFAQHAALIIELLASAIRGSAAPGPPGPAAPGPEDRRYQSVAVDLGDERQA